MKAAARVILHGARIDFTTWSLQTLEEFREEQKETILAAATEAIHLALKEPAYVWFPIEWDRTDGPSGGAERTPSTDPMAMCVELPLGQSEYDNPTWTFSISEAVESVIAGLDCGGKRIPAESACEPILRVRDGLRALAQRIDAAIAERIAPATGTAATDESG
jgi:hypothetical protein